MHTKQYFTIYHWLVRLGLAVMMVLLTLGSAPVKASFDDKEIGRPSGLAGQDASTNVFSPTNQAPIAVDDSGVGYATDNYQTITTGNVLANDLDPDGKPLIVQSFDAGGAKGQVQYITPGSLDTGFGSGGIAKTEFVVTNMGPAWGNALLQQKDGKLVVVGEYIEWGVGTYFGLARFYPNGSLDASFGSGGKVGTRFNQDFAAFAAALQPDGKIIAVGGANNNVFAAVRYNQDGSLDSSFGSGGLVTTDFPGANLDYAEAVVVQSDLKIVLAGNSEGDFGNNEVVLARYKPNGSLDTSYGNLGKVVTNFGGDSNDSVSDAVLQADGKIVIVGFSDNGPVIARFKTDGSLDNNFGTGGSTNFINGGPDGFTITLQGDGKILAAGQNGGNIYIERFSKDGLPDASFGLNGVVKTGVSNCLGGSRGSLKVQANGKMIYAGTCGNTLTFTLARYNQDGSLDTSFGSGGIAMPGLGGDSVAHGVVFQPDGKLVAAGETGGNFCLARYNSDGTFRYNPNGQFDSLPLGQTAHDTFTYVASDGILTDTAAVTIAVEKMTPVFLPMVGNQ
jgi:uncharacterized delta-60 repeat protein